MRIPFSCRLVPLLPGAGPFFLELVSSLGLVPFSPGAGFLSLLGPWFSDLPWRRLFALWMFRWDSCPSWMPPGDITFVLGSFLELPFSGRQLLNSKEDISSCPPRIAFFDVLWDRFSLELLFRGSSSITPRTSSPYPLGRTSSLLPVPSGSSPFRGSKSGFFRRRFLILFPASLWSSPSWGGNSSFLEGYLIDIPRGRSFSFWVLSGPPSPEGGNSGGTGRCAYGIVVTQRYEARACLSLFCQTTNPFL